MIFNMLLYLEMDIKLRLHIKDLWVSIIVLLSMRSELTWFFPLLQKPPQLWKLEHINKDEMRLKFDRQLCSKAHGSISQIEPDSESVQFTGQTHFLHHDCFLICATTCASFSFPKPLLTESSYSWEVIFLEEGSFRSRAHHFIHHCSQRHSRGDSLWLHQQFF